MYGYHGKCGKNCANLVEADTLNFLYRISPQKVWEENYVVGNFNALKSDEQTDLDVIEKAERGG